MTAYFTAAEPRRYASSAEIPAGRLREGGIVYIVSNKAVGLVKIGATSGPLSRIGTLERMGGHRFSEIYISAVFNNCYGVEKKAHSKFADKRLFGEWFSVAFEDAISTIEEYGFCDIGKEIPRPKRRVSNKNKKVSAELDKLLNKIIYGPG